MDQEAQLRRCNLAKQLLQHEATQAAKKEIEETLKTQWMLAPTPEERERVYAQLVALGDLFGLLEGWTVDGEIAARTERRLAQ